jgi:hypothetical protein
MSRPAATGARRPLGGLAREAGEGAGRLLGQYAARAEGGWRDFSEFCAAQGEAYVPANPNTVREFIASQVQFGKKPATIQRYVATISRVHTAAHLPNPCSSEAVRLGLKKMGRETSARQEQAHPLSWKDIKEFIDSAGEGLRADR